MPFLTGLSICPPERGTVGFLGGLVSEPVMGGGVGFGGGTISEPVMGGGVGFIGGLWCGPPPGLLHLANLDSSLTEALALTATGLMGLVDVSGVLDAALAGGLTATATGEFVLADASGALDTSLTGALTLDAVGTFGEPDTPYFLYPTGVDDSYLQLSDLDTDYHYVDSFDVVTQNPFTIRSDYTAQADSVSSASAFVSRLADGHSDPLESNVYTTHFQIPPAVDVLTWVLYGRLAVAGALNALLVNGLSTGYALSGPGWHTFTLDFGNWETGDNYLQYFTAQGSALHASNEEGLRVEYTLVAGFWVEGAADATLSGALALDATGEYVPPPEPVAGALGAELDGELTLSAVIVYDYNPDTTWDATVPDPSGWWNFESQDGSHHWANEVAGESDWVSTSTYWTAATGLVGNCAQHTGAGFFTPLTNTLSSGLVLGASDSYTLCGWWKLSGGISGTATLFQEANPGVGAVFWLTLDGSGNVTHYHMNDHGGSDYSVTQTSQPTPSGWHFFAARFDYATNTISLSVDGQVDVSAVIVGGNVSSTHVASISEPSPGSGLNLDSYGLWKGTALTFAQVLTLWDGSYGKTYP